MTLAASVLELLRSEGVDRVFGNPGTTELPLLRELAAGSSSAGPEYVLALQEFSAVAAADGYARGTGRPAVAVVHAVPGVSNALIGLNNARRSRTPLVVLAGQQDQRMLRDEPMLGGDLVGLAASSCRSAEEVHTAEDLLPMLRRAFATARLATGGPAFLSVPVNLLDEPARPLPHPIAWTTPDPSSMAAVVASQLAEAERPAILAGDRVGATGAVAELTEVAELLGATVYPQPQYEFVNADTEHPLTAPAPAFFASEVAKALSGHDALLIVGAEIRPQMYTPGPAIPDELLLAQIDDDQSRLGRPVGVHLPCWGSIPGTLRAMVDALRDPSSGLVDPDLPARARERVAAAPHAAEREAWRARARKLRGPAPVDPSAAAQDVADALAPGTVVVEEAVTSGPLLRRALPQRAAGDYHNSSGNGGLGWGIGAAVGLALAHPDRPVLAFLGDGCAMFGVQGLWTAARVGAAVTFVVVANGEYRTLKDSLGADFAGMDLGRPAVDWVGLATSLGVPARRVTHSDEIGPAVRAAQASGQPRMVVVPIGGFAA